MYETLRFVHSGGTTSFYNDETIEMIVDNIQKVDRVQDVGATAGYFSGNFRQIFLGNSYKKIDITFNFDVPYEDVLTKLNTLYALTDSYGQPEIVECYYEYAINTATMIYAQLKRDDYLKNYESGLTKDVLVKMTFYESYYTSGNLSIKEIA